MLRYPLQGLSLEPLQDLVEGEPQEGPEPVSLQIAGLPDEIIRVINSMITRALVVVKQREDWYFFVALTVKANAPYRIFGYWAERGRIKYPIKISGTNTEFHHAKPITDQMVRVTKDTIQRGMIQGNSELSYLLGRMYRAGPDNYHAYEYACCLINLLHILNG